MRRVALALALAVVALGLHARTEPPSAQAVRSPARAPSPLAVERGRRVYEEYGCGMCHGRDGAGGFRNANAETDGKVPGVIYVAEGYTAAELRQRVLDGTATVGKADPKGPRPPFRMPGWAGRMSDRQADDLVQYLMSLYPKSAELKWR